MNQYATLLIPSVLLLVLCLGYWKNVNVFETFIEGAKEGLEITIKIVPYLLAIFVAIDLMNKSGLISIIISILKPVANLIHFPIEVLPLIIIKPFSGSGYLVVLTDILKIYGPDSFTGRFACILAGSTETIFYVLTVYFGFVGIKKLRHAFITAVTVEVAAVFISWLVAVIFYGT
jgi:spore maturation protein B